MVMTAIPQCSQGLVQGPAPQIPFRAEGRQPQPQVLSLWVLPLSRSHFTKVMSQGNRGNIQLLLDREMYKGQASVPQLGTT